jgi:hypothetical protein
MVFSPENKIIKNVNMNLALFAKLQTFESIKMTKWPICRDKKLYKTTIIQLLVTF